MIIGVEINRAFDFVKEFGVTKEFLANANHAKISVIQGREFALKKISILSQNITKEITVPSPVHQMIKT